MRFRAAALRRFFRGVFGSALAVAVEMDRLESPWPNSAWDLGNGSFDPVPLQFVTHKRHFEDAGVVNHRLLHCSSFLKNSLVAKISMWLRSTHSTQIADIPPGQVQSLQAGGSAS